MSTILFVCEGNLCRSPLAASLLQLSLARGGVSGLSVASAGVRAVVDGPGDRDSAAVADMFGADMTHHVAHQLTADDLEEASLVLASSRAERSQAVRFLPRAVGYTLTIRQCGRLLAAADTDGQLEQVASAPKPDVRLARLVESAMAQRGQQRSGSAEDDDVADPYGRSHAAHEQAARQMLPALDLVSRFLGGASVSWPIRR